MIYITITNDSDKKLKVATSRKSFSYVLPNSQQTIAILEGAKIKFGRTKK